MSQKLRTPSGGCIDRSSPVHFTFDGRTYEGYRGDTLASALLANDVRLLGRSFKYHRPRGVLAAGCEEPNALVGLGEGGCREPNARATMIELYDGLVACSQNAWPSLRCDIGAINSLIAPLIPAGFYYKTFIGGPKGTWTRLYEPAIRRMAGLGDAPLHPDNDVYDKRHAYCDVLVVGAGAAGLAAAMAAVDEGARVILIDEHAAVGGTLRGSTDQIEGTAAWRWAQEAGSALANRDRCLLLSRTTAFGRYDHGLVMAVERLTDHDPSRSGPRQRLWQIRARQIVLATGAHEQPLLFGNNDLPGIMLAGAGQLYARYYGALAGRRILIGAIDDSGFDAATALAESGAEIVGIVDGRHSKARTNFPVHERSSIVRAIGRHRVAAADIVTESGTKKRIACDAILMAGGWQPALHLYAHVGGRTRYDERLGSFIAASSVDGVQLAGSCAGTRDLARCLAEGKAAGADAATGRPRAKRKLPPNDAHPVTADPFRGPTSGKCFVDFQNDVTLSDIALAGREGFVSVEHLKRYTTTGMATDQGKTSNINALKAMGAILGVAPSAVGTTTFRPPFTPVTFGALAGLNLGTVFDPFRLTPMHDWHVARGAVFEDVGQWKRPAYYPRSSETMDEAIRRECRAVRNGVGMIDASSLGKIDIKGPDAATFLDRVYINAWTSLPVLRSRYGVMLAEDGMVLDDGVTTRLGPDHYLMTTTSGNAALVLEHLEDYLQTEWPELQVYLTSVTEHWSVTTVTGPKARELLSGLVTGVDLSDEAFPHLSMREAKLEGYPVRIFRISFTGERSYEIHSLAQHGAEIWEIVHQAGQSFGIMPFGLEAIHVLRAEKGYIAIGQETDGTVTPDDLGLGRLISHKKADFIGKRSLRRADLLREDRLQLVGLRPLDSTTVIDEGAQLLAPHAGKVGGMIGHVTSSYWSDAAAGPIALAMLAGGRARHGEIVEAWSRGHGIACTVGPPIFYDVEGARLHA